MSKLLYYDALGEGFSYCLVLFTWYFAGCLFAHDERLLLGCLQYFLLLHFMHGLRA